MNEIKFKEFYQAALKGHEGQYHYAAHSHHLWPDVSKLAHEEAWNDAALKSDNKWGKIFETIIPDVQKLIADILHLKESKNIVFAPNTHELVNRLFSLFPHKQEIKLLTTDSEFHSFNRQLSRLEEDGRVVATRVNTDSIFTDRKKWVDDFIQKIQTTDFDMIFMSTVFFNSGFAFSNADLERIVESVPKKTMIVLDGYHGFCALPYDFSKLEGRIFFIAGGYKYAQAGEGVCFMVTPPGEWRPANTGWFAEFNNLHLAPGKTVAYAEGANAFWGGTFDPTGLYRFRAIWSFFKEQGITVSMIHAHVFAMQKAGLTNGLHQDQLLMNFDDFLDGHHGHFLTYQHSTEEAAQAFSNRLTEKKILHDRRGTRVRLGFGLYQDFDDVLYLVRNYPYNEP